MDYNKQYSFRKELIDFCKLICKKYRKEGSMYQPSISIIIPAYNAANTIAKCLQSVISQKYINYECIIINDGSEDNTEDICKQIIEQNNKFLIVHQKNAGVSAARNKGITLAHGDFITFIDADDSVSEDYLTHLMDFDEDLVCLGRQYINDTTGDIKRVLGSVVDKVVNVTEDHILDGIHNCYLKATTSKKFRKKIIHDNGLLFDVNTSWAEDTVFVVSYMIHCNTLRYSIFNDYYYLDNQGDSLSTAFSEKRYNAEIYAYQCIEHLLYEKYGHEFHSFFGAEYYEIFETGIMRCLTSSKLTKNEKIILMKDFANNPVFGDIKHNVYKYSKCSKAVKWLLSHRKFGMLIEISHIANAVTKKHNLKQF